MNSIDNIELRACDGVTLCGMHYCVAQPKARIVIASATGVPQGFYKHFASRANKQGFDVLTFDYRGIGQSAPATLKGFHVDYRDWATKDLATALAWANKGDVPLFVVGHSYGGHAVGLLEDQSMIEGAYVFGTGAGWSGWMPFLERIKVTIMWHVLAPALVRCKGFLAWSALGMGEDLPKGVYQQWKRWCSFPHYFFDDPKMQGVETTFAQYKKDLVAVNAIDDKWAQPASRDAFVKGYRNANVIKVDVVPCDHNLDKIDHMGYFRKQAEGLWLPVFKWIDEKVC